MLPILKYWDSWPETTTYDAYYSITQKTVDGCLEIDVEMPGVAKEEIELISDAPANSLNDFTNSASTGSSLK